MTQAANGGAIALVSLDNNKLTANITDASFTDNKAIASSNNEARGGAIMNSGATLNINANKSAIYSGNYAEIGGVKSDAFGGFLYMNSLYGQTPVANFNVSEGATLSIGDGRFGYDSIASTDNTAIINKSGAGTLTVNGSMDYYTGTLNVNEGVMNLNNKISASALNVAEGADFNVAFSQGNVGSYILKVSSISGFSESNKLNVGFDVRNNGADLLGTTTSIFEKDSAKVAYDIAGEGSTYAVGNMFLTYTDNDGVVTIGDTLSIGNSSLGGTQAVITKDADSGDTKFETTKNQAEVVVENTKQTVNEVVATESKLVVGQNSEVKTERVSSKSKIVVNEETARVEVSASIADTATIEISAGELAVSGDTSLGEGNRNTTIASENADINASAGRVVLTDASKSLELSGDITVESGKKLEIAGALAISGEKLITSNNAEVKLQSTITLADSSSKLTLTGNTSGTASFVGVDNEAKSTVVISGMLSVGNSPAEVSYKNVSVNFGEITENTNVLKMEVFGTGNVAGKDFDKITLDNATLDFGAGNTGKLELVIAKQSGTSFTEGEHVIQFFELTNGSSITGLESGDVTIVLASTLKDNWEVVFSATGTKDMTDEGAFESLMSEGKVSLMFTQIPEPSSIAALIGVLALGLAIYRKKHYL